MAKLNGAQLLVKCLEKQGVKYIFGIPGAKIDRVFDALLESKIKLVVCRHEQNAAFIAAAYGRLTGTPGVILVTSGPGVANLATGLLTATTEGDPVIAIGGNVPRAMSFKQSHQNADNVKLMEGVTKSSVEARLPENIPEIIENAFRIATAPTSGACFISLPQDVLEQTTAQVPLPALALPRYDGAAYSLIEKAAVMINQASNPVLLLGMEASRPDNAHAIREFLKKTLFAVVGTYQAAGVIPKEYVDCFIGRVGLFKNQPGDQVLDKADLVITIGYNPVEYDPEVWNANSHKKIIHIDYSMCKVHATYVPVCELIGDIATSINRLGDVINQRKDIFTDKTIKKARQELFHTIESGKEYDKKPIHPLRFIYELRQAVDDSVTICCDIGTVYMWMARYFFSYRPHQLLFSNGQQTLGVALPWAIACNYAKPSDKIVSISGDGGFLFSAMELETAVREGLHFIHYIWRDGSYNMVLEQELMKYNRKSGVDLGGIDIPSFAQSFGALGLELNDPNQFQELYHIAMASDKPVLIDVPIDYSDNQNLFKAVDPRGGH
ncbi:acetolactate synthase AlsS [Legionella londiniensis]|uniref:Acetolactate synthase n=1 Tax=Legionella londiniensis TaxID=45068 RepID=A0A0W0VJM3_9GAMM|nr:acetolactate synthase AlsS [Legionella londiniensis]KTD20303.1 acetolactate synthase [Legionella londiniensis]STX93905.1 acetolactate synthase [Legionella londiniensis]